MDQKIRCQSCGMPIGEGFYGTDKDGKNVSDFCKYCFQMGNFTEPDLALDQMIDNSVKYMMEEGIPEDEARGMSNALIPTLARWQKN